MNMIPPFEKSKVVVPLFKVCICCFRLATFYFWIDLSFRIFHKKVTSWFIESYVIFFAFLSTIFLFTMGCEPPIWWLARVIVIVRLWEIFVKIGIITFKDAIPIQNNDTGHYILVPSRNPLRFVALILTNIYEIIICYAVLYLQFGTGFYEKINCPVTAIYQSILTFTTLGYGEIRPINPLTKVLVISQLVFFILMILMVAPRIFSLLRTEKKEK